MAHRFAQRSYEAIRTVLRSRGACSKPKRVRSRAGEVADWNALAAEADAGRCLGTRIREEWVDLWRRGIFEEEHPEIVIGVVEAALRSHVEARSGCRGDRQLRTWSDARRRRTVVRLVVADI